MASPMVKDLLKYVGRSLPKDRTLRDIMRKAYYVPETKHCDELFKEMSESHVQMAIVVDEYGGTAGLVTLEDVLESIVGNIQDEYDNEDEEISKINDTTFTIDGITDLDEVDELIGADLPEGDYDTLGGFITSQLGFLPGDGEMNVVEYENIRFTVLSVEERRIGKVRVEILPPKGRHLWKSRMQAKKNAAACCTSGMRKKQAKRMLSRRIKLLSFLHHKTKKARCIVVCSVPFYPCFFRQAAAFFSACSGGSSSGISLSFSSSLRRLRS